jgi:hypothetical protein
MVLGMGLRNGILAIPNPISRPKAVLQQKKGRSLFLYLLGQLDFLGLIVNRKVFISQYSWHL